MNNDTIKAAICDLRRENGGACKNCPRCLVGGAMRNAAQIAKPHVGPLFSQLETFAPFLLRPLKRLAGGFGPKEITELLTELERG